MARSTPLSRVATTTPWPVSPAAHRSGAPTVAMFGSAGADAGVMVMASGVTCATSGRAASSRMAAALASTDTALVTQSERSPVTSPAPARPRSRACRDAWDRPVWVLSRSTTAASRFPRDRVGSAARSGWSRSVTRTRIVPPTGRRSSARARVCGSGASPAGTGAAGPAMAVPAPPTPATAMASAAAPTDQRRRGVLMSDGPPRGRGRRPRGPRHPAGPGPGRGLRCRRGGAARRRRCRSRGA